jgi:hypothetical protein
MFSQITPAKAALPDLISARSSAIPPSRGMPTAANRRHAPVWLRASRSVPPDSTSQKAGG